MTGATAAQKRKIWAGSKEIGLEQADLRVRIDVATWRALNRGEIAAPEAVLRRRLTMEGDFLLGLKLHLILS